MGNWEKEIATEQNRANEVAAKITKAAAAIQQVIGNANTDIKSIRKHFWDDVTVNLDNADEIGETYTSIKQQSELLNERERRQNHSFNRIQLLKRLNNSPYFGRIDFIEHGESETEKIYIGICSFYDEETESFLVYDWRAPISSVYYDYPLGPAAYEAPYGKISGTLELKRQYIIRNGEITSVFDTGVTIGDELLQEVLGGQADSQMKSIVATIQKEQNLIIRNDKSRLLIVQGAAGSGKTSAALQRVAYLLYRYRVKLTADNILLFSPNPLFNSYVANVLPELGEENMQQTTFQQYLLQMLGREFDVEDAFIQMEYVLTAVGQPGYDTRLNGISFKSSLEFMEMIEGYLEELMKSGMIFTDIKFLGRVLISSQSIYDYFYGLGATRPISNRMKLVSEWLRKELRRYERQEVKKSWVEEEMQYLDKEDYLKSYQKVSNEKRMKEDTFDDIEREQEVLAAFIVKRRFRPLYKKVKEFAFLDAAELYRRLFEKEASAADWKKICHETIANLDDGELLYEDAAPFLFFKEQVEGFKTNTLIRHVFIDEAQDYSPFQFAFIKKIFPRSKLTVLGDSNQTIFAQGNEVGLEVVASLFMEEETEKITLTRSYRSTLQIVEFTRKMIEGGDEIEPFNRKGNKPVVLQVNDEQDTADCIAETIKGLQAQGHHTIAIICKTASESREAYLELKERLSLKLIGTGKTDYEAGIVVIPSYLAKGIEFDAVVIYDGSKKSYGLESERRLFYTVCTRAMHELYICSKGEISPFVAETPANLYEQRTWKESFHSRKSK
ncbi:helicase [Peribacillus cavernae]|uniref:Helicase n=1 Tax=Peribacillus cavernae TaxID=1674310 RepID=A0A433HPG5_9BACI|nr:RNA polymerase recycling motor HelD [Peribacillus cavernae]MDQ0217356.1 DNA helicase-2/ATP-dependent DNA helicase PcrA [Peribacillus cavernae]RUQ30193.1 helicase [Peribacillus cavernae]